MEKDQSTSSIDDYIQRQPPAVQGVLGELRQLIRKAAPKASEKISYQMPTFYLNGNLVHFAACKGHIGFYPTPSAIEKFRGELKRYKTSKGAVQFPLTEPLPRKLITQMVNFRVAENEAKAKR
jgi:uncharacterized protein YdhG (YjbR/CyaY superfamily)